MIPKKLISYINSGRCFALIGSGPSTPLKYPTWRFLAEHAAQLVSSTTPTYYDAALVRSLLKAKDYPELFEYAANSLGDAAKLADAISPLFQPRGEFSQAYQYLARWPFRCYLTTNYDDELKKHLDREDVYFSTLHNSQADLAQITAQSCGLIVKLHSDFTRPEGLVLTSSQYAAFKVGGSRQYYRTALMSMFAMVPVVVIGHSMSDPDLLLILEYAREAASPDLPIFMVVADAGRNDIRKYRERYNIELISYPNLNGTHDNLTHVLRQIDRFVIPRRASPRPPLDFPDAAESETGAALYVYSALALHHDDSLLKRLIEPQLLAALATQPNQTFSEGTLATVLQPPNVRSQTNIISEIRTALASLQGSHLVEAAPGGFRAAQAGADKFAQIVQARRIDEDQVFGALRNRLQKVVASASECEKLVKGFRTALMTVLRRRGLAAAEMLFRNNPFEPPDMPELFESVFPAAAETDNYEARSEYCDFVMSFLTAPNDLQRRFLANMSQGFFAYHMFGHDPSGSEIRRRLTQDTVWLFDSNVLLPLLADECHSHTYTMDLLARLRSLGITPVTTRAFVKEVSRVLTWATRRLQATIVASEHEAMLGLLRGQEYRENLFIDGYIRGQAKSRWRSFQEYVKHLKLKTEHDVESRVTGLGIRIIASVALSAFTSEDVDEQTRLSGEILMKRKLQGTVRGGEVQTDAEAEALQMIRAYRKGTLAGDGKPKRAYFVSTSRLLDVMYRQSDGLLTWLPESLYKHLQYLAPGPVDSSKMFEALASSYYAVGVNVIDEDAYKSYFKPAIGESKIVFEREKLSYLSAVNEAVESQQRSLADVERDFARVPDLEKPEFVSRMGWAIARRAEQKTQEAEAAREKAERATAEARKQAEQIQEEGRKKSKQDIEALKAEYARKDEERRKHEEGRLRNLQDSKHLRKRERQAKKRRKGK